MKTCLKVAVVCGVVPLVAGIGIFVAWLITRATWLEGAGVLTMVAGVGLVAAGTVFLAIYVVAAWRRRELSRRRIFVRAAGVLALYGANFVAADGAIMGAWLIQSRYTVTVVNRSNAPLQSGCIEGGGVVIHLEDVPPGETIRESFWIGTDGTLALSGRHGQADVEVIVDSYVTNGAGGDKTVTLDGDGELTVTGTGYGTN